MVVKSKKKTNTLALIVAGTIALVFIISCIIIATSNKSNVNFFNINKERAFGIDVSEHNGKIDWQAVSKEVDFAFIRVGYRSYGIGNIGEDKLAKENLKAAKKAGVNVGVYFYSQAITQEEACEEADFVIDFIKHYQISLPVFIDFEYAYTSDGELGGRLFDASLTPQQSTDLINAFCDKITKAGYTAGVYASSGVLKNNLVQKNIDKDTVIWVADYNNSVTHNVDYDIWQYSKTGSCNGVNSKYVDCNIWYLTD